MSLKWEAPLGPNETDTRSLDWSGAVADDDSVAQVTVTVNSDDVQLVHSWVVGTQTYARFRALQRSTVVLFRVNTQKGEILDERVTLSLRKY